MSNKSNDGSNFFVQKAQEEIEKAITKRDLYFKSNPSFQNIERISKIISITQPIAIQKKQMLSSATNPYNNVLNLTERLSALGVPYNDLLKQQSMEISKFTKALGPFYNVTNRYNKHDLQFTSIISSIQKVQISNNSTGLLKQISLAASGLEKVAKSKALVIQLYQDSNQLNLNILATLKFASKTTELKNSKRIVKSLKEWIIVYRIFLIM